MSVSPEISPRAPQAGQLPRRTHVQYAALCFRIRDGRLKILLITSRGSGRWTLPKGWPMKGQSPARSAAREAWEEAGIRGEVQETCVGGFTYVKRNSPHPHMALVYPLEVTARDKSYPERGERKQRWVSPKRAAEMVDHPELAQLLRDFSPLRPRH